MLAMYLIEKQAGGHHYGLAEREKLLEKVCMEAIKKIFPVSLITHEYFT